MKKPAAVIIGSGIIYKKITKELSKKCLIYKEIPLKNKKPDYVFLVDKKSSSGGVKNLLKQINLDNARVLLVVSDDEINNIKNLDNIDIRVVKSPPFLFEELDIIDSVYIKKCINIIMEAMFGPNTRGGLFILPEPPFNEQTSQQKRSGGRKISFLKNIPFKKVILFLAILFTVPIITTFMLIFLGFWSLVFFQSSYLSGKIDTSKNAAKLAVFSFDRGQEINNFIVFSRLNQVLDIGSSISHAGQHLSAATENLQLLFSGIITKNNYDYKNLNSARVELLAAHEQFVKTRFLLSNTKTGISFLDSKIENLEQDIVNHTVLLGKAAPLLEIVPELIGINGKKTYLILLQNSDELRATGGFIGSYGILSFKDGQMLEFSIFDVYTADGQLKGHVEPPLPIKKHLEQPHWYLRDSNWSPDFEASGARAAWFLEKEVGIKVDGVIGTNTHLTSMVLEAMGEVYLPDYGETITKDNLTQRANFWAHRDFFAGSTAKADFLASLTNAIFDKLRNDKNISWQQVLLGLIKGINEKHLMFAFIDPKIQHVFTLGGFSATLSETRADKEGVLNDFLMVVDSNLGVNKANYFIQRKVSQDITISEDGLVGAFLKIKYENSSPGEKYKNYLRVVMPKGSVFKRADVDNTEIKEINIEEDARTTFGFLVNIPAGSTRAIEIEYELSNKFPITKGAGFYSLRVLKQSGTIKDPFVLTINYPKNLKVENIEKPQENRLILHERTLTIISDLQKDREFEAIFLSN